MVVTNAQIIITYDNIDELFELNKYITCTLLHSLADYNKLLEMKITVCFEPNALMETIKHKIFDLADFLITKKLLVDDKSYDADTTAKELKLLRTKKPDHFKKKMINHVDNDGCTPLHYLRIGTLQDDNAIFDFVLSTPEFYQQLHENKFGFTILGVSAKW